MASPSCAHRACVGQTCTLVAGAGANECAVNADCIPTYTVSGRVYLDNAGVACDDTSQPVLPGIGSTVRSTGLAEAGVGADGRYSWALVPEGVRVLTLNPTDLNLRCKCPAGCSASVNVTGNTVQDFYVTDIQLAWWQTRGGDIGANGGDVVTSIPSTCTLPVCNPYVSGYDSLGTIASSGVMWYGSGTGNNRYGDRTAQGTDYGANSSMRTSTKREGYEYFYRLFEMGLDPAEDPELAGFNETDIG